VLFKTELVRKIAALPMGAFAPLTGLPAHTG